MSLINKERDYKHLLCYDQFCQPGLEYGYTNFYFDFDHDRIYVKKVDERINKSFEIDFPFRNPEKNIISELRAFLINLMSNRSNFFGTPFFINSKVFTEAEFDEMLKRGIEKMGENDAIAMEHGAKNELILFCKSVGLNPKPDGSNPYSWEANCISSGQHQLMISTSSNQWGCGYCRKKGDLNELKEWYQIKNNKEPI